MFPSTRIVDVTAVPTAIPVSVVPTALEVDNTRMLFAVVVLPTMLPLTGDCAVALFTKTPVKNDGPAAAPPLLISNPPILLLRMDPPVLVELMPLIYERYVLSAVLVVILIEPATVVEPIVFSSPASVPPTVIPEPRVSIPKNTGCITVALFGEAVTLIAATVFPLITDAGVALDVVRLIPS